MSLAREKAYRRLQELRDPKRKIETAHYFFQSFMGRQPTSEEVTYFTEVFYSSSNGEFELDQAFNTFFASKEFLFRSIVHAIGADRDFRQLWEKAKDYSLFQLTAWALNGNDNWVKERQEEKERERQKANQKKKGSFRDVLGFEVLGVTISPLGPWGSQK